MAGTVIYAFGTAPDLVAVRGAASHAALARQLPRLIVARLNGSGDRGVRFFPFLGLDAGKRRFLEVREMLPDDVLLQLHSQRDVVRVVGGLLHARGIDLRVLASASGEVLFAQTLPFAAHEPWGFVRRALFELDGLLGGRGVLPPLPALAGEALACFLNAKDDLLALEANFVRADTGAVAATAERLLALAPAEAEAREVALEVAARLVAGGVTSQGLAQRLLATLPHASAAPAFVERAAVLAAAAAPAHALEAWLALAEQVPAHATAAVRAAALLTRQGDTERAGALVERAFAAGCRAPELLAQRAQLAERQRDLATRDGCFDALLAHAELPAAVTQLTAQNLIRRGRIVEAKGLVLHALSREPAHAGLNLDKARACILLGEVHEARQALQTVARQKLAAPVRLEVERLLRYATRPQALQALQACEQALGAGELPTALAHAKLTVRAHADVAEAWLMLGIVRQRKNQLWRAMRAFRQALRRDPELGEAHNRLGTVLLQRGQHLVGYMHLRHAVELLPLEPAPRLHLAQACSLTGKREEGEQMLVEAERLGATAATVAAVRRAFFADAG